MSSPPSKRTCVGNNSTDWLTAALKRFLDVVGAALALVLFSPVLAAVALLTRREMGPPALFRQERIGRGGSTFAIVKFRTMTDAEEASGQLLPDAERLTRYGMALRSTSLDELPQLWAVLRGQMSLVGPRPLPSTYMYRFTEYEFRRHNVRPGLTGLAQTRGRNLLSWEERLALDSWYADNHSMCLDLEILGRTIVAVLCRSGISSASSATMPELLPPGLRPCAQREDS